MNKNSLYVSEIKIKIFNLLNQNKILVQQNDALQKELKILNKTIETQKNCIEELKDNNKIVKLANEIHLSELDKKKLKKELTEKIILIDECIKMLSQ